MDNQIENWLRQKAAIEGKALEATLELTPICNMNCRMCYIHHSKHETEEEGGLKPLAFWLRQIDQMKGKRIT